MGKQIESKSSNRLTKVKKVIVYGFLICFAFLFIVYLWVRFDIRFSVKEISDEATQQYPGDRVEALIACVKSEDHSPRQRNRAVWTLGQIGDKHALPVLTSFIPTSHVTTIII